MHLRRLPVSSEDGGPIRDYLGDEPANIDHLDDRNQRCVLTECSEGSAEVVRLSHGAPMVCHHRAKVACPCRAPHSIYKRNGTTTLFAALNMLDGTVIGECMPRHRHREFLRFLKTIDEREDAAQSRPASHRRQLCHPQDPRGEALAKAAFALSPALHAHFRLVAQHGRAVLCRDHPKSAPAAASSECRRIEASHHGLSRQPQRQSQALRLDEDCRRNLQ